MHSDRQVILNSGAHLKPVARKRMVVMVPVIQSRGSHNALSKPSERSRVKGSGRTIVLGLTGADANLTASLRDEREGTNADAEES